MFGLVVVLVVVGTTIWVGVDAPKRAWPEKSTSTFAWVLGCLLLWIVVFPVYLYQRGKTTDTGVVAAANVAPLPQPELYRTCPHCKEPMRRDAGVCPHCRNHSAAWTLHDGHWWFRANEQDGWQWFDEPNSRWLKHALLSAPPLSADDAVTEKPAAATREAETPLSLPARPRMLGEPIRAAEAAGTSTTALADLQQ
jgi:hypothetical protein